MVGEPLVEVEVSLAIGGAPAGQGALDPAGGFGHEKDPHRDQAGDGEAQEGRGADREHGQECELDPLDRLHAEEVAPEGADLIGDLQPVGGDGDRVGVAPEGD